MSSQDKPLETNDNQNESPENSGILHQEDSLDLWSEETEEGSVTEFIVAKDTSFDESPADLEQPEADVKPSKKTLSDADFDNIDFRNPPEAEEEEELLDGLISNSSPEPENLVLETEINLNDDVQVSSVESTFLENPVDENVVSEIQLDDLGELDIAVDSSTEIELDSLDDLNNLDGDLSTLDVADEIQLDDLAINLEEAVVSSNNGEDLQLAELDDLVAADSLDESVLDNLDNDLDGLLDLGSETDSLDSLVLDDNNSLDAIENSLDEDLELAQLDSLLWIVQPRLS